MVKKRGKILQVTLNLTLFQASGLLHSVEKIGTGAVRQCHQGERIRK